LYSAAPIRRGLVEATDKRETGGMSEKGVCIGKLAMRWQRTVL